MRGGRQPILKMATPRELLPNNNPQSSEVSVRRICINSCETPPPPIKFFIYIEWNSNRTEFKDLKRIFPAVSGLSSISKLSNC